MGRTDLAKVSLRVFFDEEECFTKAGWGADDGIHGPDDLPPYSRLGDLLITRYSITYTASLSAPPIHVI